MTVTVAADPVDFLHDTTWESAPANVLFKHFGFTPENVADTVRAVLGR